jgi:hypothetical protein
MIIFLGLEGFVIVTDLLQSLAGFHRTGAVLRTL